MFGDNESVVNLSTKIHAKLYKRHTAVSFHRVREAIASKYVPFNFLPGSENPADVLSKHWSYNSVKDVLLPMFHRNGAITKFKDSQKFEQKEELGIYI